MREVELRRKAYTYRSSNFSLAYTKTYTWNMAALKERQWDDEKRLSCATSSDVFSSKAPCNSQSFRADDSPRPRSLTVVSPPSAHTQEAQLRLFGTQSKSCVSESCAVRSTCISHVSGTSQSITASERGLPSDMMCDI